MKFIKRLKSAFGYFDLNEKDVVEVGVQAFLKTHHELMLIEKMPEKDRAKIVEGLVRKTIYRTLQELAYEPNKRSTASRKA